MRQLRSKLSLRRRGRALLVRSGQAERIAIDRDRPDLPGLPLPCVSWKDHHRLDWAWDDRI